MFSIWFTTHFYDLSALVGCLSAASLGGLFTNFVNVCPFNYTTFAVSGKVGYP